MFRSIVIGRFDHRERSGATLTTAAGFGLLVGTVMTLVVTPVTYTLLDDALRLGTRRWRDVPTTSPEIKGSE